jgi:uncharacterized protein (DUF58 family)
MRFVFARLFYVLLALGFVPLSLAWSRPGVATAVLAYDLLLLAAAFVDAGRSRRLPGGLAVSRDFSGRFHIGGETEVRVRVVNGGVGDVRLRVKDEYPPRMKLTAPREAALAVEGQSAATLIYGLVPPRRGRFEFGEVAVRYLSRWRLVWRTAGAWHAETVKVYPNLRRAREAELKALGARSLVAAHRRAAWRGEGRDFESMRDYVPGDELRHVSWTATARRASTRSSATRRSSSP